MSLPPSASDTARRRALRVLYADRVVQETALQYGLRNSIAWEGEPGNRAGTNRIFGEYQGGMLETTEAERNSYVASVPQPGTVAPDAPGNLSILAYYQKLVVVFTQPTNVLAESPISYTVTVSPGGFTASGSTVPIVVTGITNGDTYSVSVVATNAAGTSPAAVGTVDSTYAPEVFTSVGSTSWTAPAYVTSVEYLVVGGGGGSGGGYDTAGGGGGGGGLVLSGSASVVPGTSYTVVVGDGGAAGTSQREPVVEVRGGSGVTSMFGSIVALGGDGGYGSRQRPTPDTNAGTGGAAAVNPSVAAEGGVGGFSTGGGGGGGGSSGAGGNGRTPSPAAAGGGGAGTSDSLTGAAVVYGRGGNGATGNTLNVAIAGASNTGQGAKGGGTGGSAQINGAVGGSGIVVLRF